MLQQWELDDFRLHSRGEVDIVSWREIGNRGFCGEMPGLGFWTVAMLADDSARVEGDSTAGNMSLEQLQIMRSDAAAVSRGLDLF